MAYKLTVSARIEFDVKFTLNDGGEEKKFGARLSAKRIAQDKLKAEFDAGVTVGDFLKARGLTMLEWIGKPALEEEETGNPLPPGEVALQALQDLISGMVNLVYASYLEANGARGRAGN